MNICQIDGCSDRVHGNGLCQKHYMRLRRTGSTSITKRTPRPPIDKIADRIALTDSGCLIWLGPTSDGYGVVNIGSRLDGTKRHVTVHRLLYTILVGPVPDGLQLDHLCRNRLCVHPDHLEPVTQRENLLRGDTIPARWAARTHCQRGHEFTPENTYMRGPGHARSCRACRRKGGSR